MNLKRSRQTTRSKLYSLVKTGKACRQYLRRRNVTGDLKLYAYYKLIERENNVYN